MPQKLWSENKNEKPKSRISNTEWGIVIGALAIVDLIQLGLDLLFQVGVIANRFIDVAVGFAWPTYLYLRGVNMNVKRVGSIILSFALEEVPDIDALPFWSADGVFIMMSVKLTEKALKKAGLAATAVAAVALAPETGGASLAAEGAVEAGAVGAEAVGGAAEGAAATGAQATEAGETAGEALAGEAEETKEIGRFGADEEGDEVSDGAMDSWAEGSRESGESAEAKKAGAGNESGKSGENKNRGRNLNRGTLRRPGALGERPGQRGLGEGARGPNELDLREPKSREEEFGGSEERTGKFYSNLLDLGNSYRGGNRGREDDEE